MSTRRGVMEGQQTEETEQHWDEAAGVIDGTWEDWNDYDEWSWYDDSGDCFDWTGPVYDDGWGYDDWSAFDFWQQDCFPDRKATEEQQGPPSETSAIIPSLGEPLIEEIEDDHEAEAVSAALPTQSSSSGSRGRPPEPGLISKLFVGALMLIGTLSSGVPVYHPTDDMSLQLNRQHCQILRIHWLSFTCSQV